MGIFHFMSKEGVKQSIQNVFSLLISFVMWYRFEWSLWNTIFRWFSRSWQGYLAP